VGRVTRSLGGEAIQRAKEGGFFFTRRARPMAALGERSTRMPQKMLTVVVRPGRRRRTNLIKIARSESQAGTYQSPS